MTNLHDTVDKVFVEVDHLDRILPDLREPDASETALALSVAKRVRVACNMLVRALAERRDQLATVQEDTSE